MNRKPANMGIAGVKPRQLAPTVEKTGSESTGSPAPSSPSPRARLHLAIHPLHRHLLQSLRLSAICGPTSTSAWDRKSAVPGIDLTTVYAIVFQIDQGKAQAAADLQSAKLLMLINLSYTFPLNR
jgi:hypothetical protein